MKRRLQHSVIIIIGDSKFERTSRRLLPILWISMYINVQIEELYWSMIQRKQQNTKHQNIVNKGATFVMVCWDHCQWWAGTMHHWQAHHASSGSTLVARHHAARPHHTSPAASALHPARGLWQTRLSGRSETSYHHSIPIIHMYRLNSVKITKS